MWGSDLFHSLRRYDRLFVFGSLVFVCRQMSRGVFALCVLAVLAVHSAHALAGMRTVRRVPAVVEAVAPVAPAAAK